MNLVVCNRLSLLLLNYFLTDLVTKKAGMEGKLSPYKFI